MWFRRNDGQMFEASENSASFQMMSKSPEFDEVIETVEIDGVFEPVSEIEEVAEKVVVLTSDQTSEPETKADEIDTQIEQSALENAGTPQDSGQSGARKRGGVGRRNKAKDSDGNENGQAVS